MENRIAHALAGLGYREVITHSLRAAGDDAAVEVRNPLSEEQRFLRESLAPGLIEYLAAAGAPARVFEIGDVFRRERGAVVEQTALAFGFSRRHVRRSAVARFVLSAAQRRLRGTLARAYRTRSASLRPARGPVSIPARLGSSRSTESTSASSAASTRAWQSGTRSKETRIFACSTFARCRPTRRHAIGRRRDFRRPIATLRSSSISAFPRALSRMRSPRRSVRSAPAYRSSTSIADRRSRRDEKSLAVRVTLQRFDATITDEEADAAIARALDAVRERFGATIRT